MKTMKKLFAIMILMIMVNVMNAQSPVNLTYATTSDPITAFQGQPVSGSIDATITDTLTVIVGDSMWVYNSYAEWTDSASLSGGEPLTTKSRRTGYPLYGWDNSNTIYWSDSDNVFKFAVDSIGLYDYVIYSTTSGFASVTRMFRVNVVDSVGTGINDNQIKADVKAFPNPVADKLTVTFNTKDDHEKIEIFDIQGRLILSDTEERENGRNTVKLDVSQYSSGIYFVRVASETFKIIKQ